MTIAQMCSEGSAGPPQRKLASVAVDSIVLPAELLRRHVDEERLESLRQSIASRGVLVPLVVVEQEGGYRLVAGLRRWLCASRIGLAEVPAVVVEAGEESESWATLCENTEREDVNPVDVAVWLAARMASLGVGQRALSSILDVSESWVSQRIGVLVWPDDVREAVRQEEISFSVGRELAGIDDQGIRAYCLDTARRCGCSVRQAVMWRQNWQAGRSASLRVSPDVAGVASDASLAGVYSCSLCQGEFDGSAGLLSFICSSCLGVLDSLRASPGISSSDVSKDAPP